MDYLLVIAADEQITSNLFCLVFCSPTSDEQCVRQIESSGNTPSLKKKVVLYISVGRKVLIALLSGFSFSMQNIKLGVINN